MKLSFSLVALSCLLASSLSADVSTDLKEAFANGKISGDIVLYGEQQNNSGSNPDAGFTMGSVGLGYETADFNGFKAALGFRGNHEFSEVEDNDYDNADQPSAILHTANISYANKYVTLTLGRQEMDLEWMGDFHEAYVGVITAIPDTTITIAHSDRVAVADADGALEKFHEFSSDNGINVFDVKYEGIEGLALNAYYYNAQDVVDWYGAKVDYDKDMFGGTLHYTTSNEDVANAEDGSILAAEVRGNFSSVALTLGYITTDKDGGIGGMNQNNYDGSMATAGDNINPFEDGNQVYQADADTYYFSVGYEIKSLTLSALYGSTDYGSDSEDELNIAAEYGITDELSVGAVFVNVNAENSDDDYNRFSFTASYAF